MRLGNSRPTLECVEYKYPISYYLYYIGILRWEINFNINLGKYIPQKRVSIRKMAWIWDKVDLRTKCITRDTRDITSW